MQHNTYHVRSNLSLLFRSTKEIETIVVKKIFLAYEDEEFADQESKFDITIAENNGYHEISSEQNNDPDKNYEIKSKGGSFSDAHIYLRSANMPLSQNSLMIFFVRGENYL